jgi:hypothetical protein
MRATKSNSYTFQKDGIWYFSRRVPTDLRRHYRTGRIAYSLRTKSISDARIRAMSDASPFPVFGDRYGYSFKTIIATSFLSKANPKNKIQVQSMW